MSFRFDLNSNSVLYILIQFAPHCLQMKYKKRPLPVDETALDQLSLFLNTKQESQKTFAPWKLRAFVFKYNYFHVSWANKGNSTAFGNYNMKVTTKITIY